MMTRVHVWIVSSICGDTLLASGYKLYVYMSSVQYRNCAVVSIV